MGRLICDSVRRFPFGEGTFDSIGRGGRKGMCGVPFVNQLSS